MPETIKGRGAAFNPPNRFEKLHLEPLEIELDDEEEARRIPTIFYKDTSKSILAKNNSPDIPFTYSINPYRGCEHGCIYCYARPSHEYLGFSAGIDFETKIMVKEDAPKLLEETFQKKSWQPQMVCFSGDTDCYQPVERKLQITRHCLEVFLKYRNPVGIITKNALITRDLDILKELAALNLVITTISITSFDDELIRKMEPRTSAPYKRLETIETLATHGIPVGVNTAPIIPGLNDKEMPTILKEAAARGAKFAGYVMLRLPGAVEQLFLDWLQRELPDRASKIINRIKEVRGGKLNDPRWGSRFRGEGEIAQTIRDLFHLSCEKYGLNKEEFKFSVEHFRHEPEGQLELFGK
ncbi:MAG: PA0069 family radical SAM protein [Ignavibacteriae bacterium]|nr:PA0069 family radical SAM protein [Ignavibacteriota bacterium]